MTPGSGLARNALDTEGCDVGNDGVINPFYGCLKKGGGQLYTVREIKPSAFHMRYISIN